MDLDLGLIIVDNLRNVGKSIHILGALVRRQGILLVDDEGHGRL